MMDANSRIFLVALMQNQGLIIQMLSLLLGEKENHTLYEYGKEIRQQANDILNNLAKEAKNDSST